MFNQNISDPRARLTGIVYLLYFLTAIIAQVLFLNNTPIYITINLIAYGLYATLAVLFYYMFKPVNKVISLLAAFCALLGSIAGVFELFHITMAHISPLTFFGPYCLLIGWLIVNSTFLPRILGVFMIIAGIGWLIFLTSLQKYLATVIEVIGIAAEAFLMLWLIIKGINLQQWKEQSQKP